MTILKIEICSMNEIKEDYPPFITGIKILGDNYHIKKIESKRINIGWKNIIHLDSLDKLNLIHKDKIMDGVRDLVPEKAWEIFHYKDEDD